MSGGVRNLLAQVPEIPDRYQAQERKTPKRKQAPNETLISACPLKRVRLPSASEEEEMPETLSRPTLCEGVEGTLAIPMPAIQSTLENPEKSTSKASKKLINHRRKGALRRKSNPFIISEAVGREEEDDSDSTSSSFSKHLSLSDSDSSSDSHSDSDDCILVDNNCFE